MSLTFWRNLCNLARLWPLEVWSACPESLGHGGLAVRWRQGKTMSSVKSVKYVTQQSYSLCHLAHHILYGPSAVQRLQDHLRNVAFLITGVAYEPPLLCFLKHLWIKNKKAEKEPSISMLILIVITAMIVAVVNIQTGLNYLIKSCLSQNFNSPSTGNLKL